MYQGKHRKKSRRNSMKSGILVVSFILLVALAVGGTIAFLADDTDPVVNQFTPSKITTEVEEKLNGDTKSDVEIKNTGDTTAWIRAAVVITWQDEDGNVYGKAPVENEDYTITWNLNDGGWVEGDDSFYYWTKPVKSEKEAPNDCLTGVLITECKPVSGKAPDGYSLTVEIIGSGIQSVPAKVFNDNWSSSGLKVSTDGTALVKGGAGN